MDEQESEKWLHKSAIESLEHIGFWRKTVLNDVILLSIKRSHSFATAYHFLLWNSITFLPQHCLPGSGYSYYSNYNQYHLCSPPRNKRILVKCCLFARTAAAPDNKSPKLSFFTKIPAPPIRRYISNVTQQFHCFISISIALKTCQKIICNYATTVKMTS